MSRTVRRRALVVAAPVIAVATAMAPSAASTAAPGAVAPATAAPGAAAAPATPTAQDPPKPAQTKDRLKPYSPGSLSYGDRVRPRTVAIGGFTVQLTSGKSRRLVVTDARTGVPVWKGPKAKSFVTGTWSGLDVTEYRGYFWPTVTRDELFKSQVVTSFRRTSATTAVLAGHLTSGSGKIAWRLVLRPVQRGAATLLSASVQTGRKGGRPLDSVQLAFARGADDAVSGFGAQFRSYDLDGTLFPILVREQGVGRGQQPISGTVNAVQPGAAGTLASTYATWPSWLTSGGVAAQVVGEARSAFGTVDLRGDNALLVEMRSRRVALELASGETPAEALQAREAGRTVPGLPDWVNGGGVLGLQGGTDAVRAKLQTVLDAGAKVSGLWLQDWSGRRTTSFGDRLWWTWQLDTERYPGWDAFVDEMDARGIKVLTYVNPMLTDAAAKVPAPARNLYAEAAAQGYLVQTQKGKPYLQDQGEFTAALVDLTNPDARSWYADVIATQVLAGKVAGMMADFGEGLPFDAVLEGGSGSQWHDAYPRLWAETVREACTRAGKPDCVAFMRSGTSGSSDYAPVFWAGDQMVSFAEQDGLPSALYAIQAAGASGWPLMHSDVGGYTSIALVNYVRPPDLITRWAQFEAFGVFMRTHEGNQPDRNLQVYSNAEQAGGFALASRIYAALADYRRSVVAEAVATRLPAMRHPSLVVPGTNAAEADDQFFLGSHLLVAPVLAQGATSVDVAFPPGTWQHVLTGAVYQGGGTVTVPAPMDTPAAFVRTDDPVGAEIRSALAAAGLTTG